jgi:hypothetical protein
VNSIKHEYDRDLQTHKDSLRKQTETQLMKLNGEIGLEIEKAKLKMSFYSEEQFKLYNELWVSLCQLKNKMEELWASANYENLMEFTQQLIDTSDKLEQKALLVEPAHYEKLRRILGQFGNYKLGKKTLIELRQEQNETRNVGPREIRRLINRNRQLRDELLEYLPQMRDSLRQQISGNTS